MSESARRTMAVLILLAGAGLGWRAVRQPGLPAAAPAPCVHPVAVTGAVRAPGIVCLGPGTTALDALRAAGTRCLPAGQEGAPPPDAGDRLTVTAGPGGAASACRVERGRLPARALRTLRVPIDPNRASEDELRALPGIGPALARRIVESRRAEGPFLAVEELRRVRGIGPQTLARLRDRLEIGAVVGPRTDRWPPGPP